MKCEDVKPRLDALMGKATLKKTVNSTQNAAPDASRSKTLMASLFVGGALIGALITGLFYRPIVVVPVPVINEEVKGSGEDPTLFYSSLARFRK